MRQKLKEFGRDESGSEMSEFALALAIFSFAALIGWGAIATAASVRENTMQNNLSTSVINPP